MFFEHQEPLDPTKTSLDGFRTSRFARFFEPPRKGISESVARSWSGLYAAPTHIGTPPVNGIGNVKRGRKKPIRSPHNSRMNK